MRKEYESPMCKVVMVEKKDVLTASITSFMPFNIQEDGVSNMDSDGHSGAYIGWGSKKW